MSLRKVNRIASLSFKITGAQGQSNEIRELAGLLRTAGQAMTALSLLALGTGFILKKPWSGDFAVKKLEHLVSDEFAEEFKEELTPIYERYGALMLAFAQIQCPVRTGRLARSLKMKVTENGVALISDCHYYWVVEAKHGFVKAAVEFYEPLMMAEIDALIAAKQKEEIAV